MAQAIMPTTPRPSIRVGQRDVGLRRAILSPNFKNKTVLTDSTWRYVEIFLKEQKAHDALFYWEQAQSFYHATRGLSLVAMPLTTYYAFLNATKALLVYKKIGFDAKHGVSGSRKDGHYNLQNEIIRLKPRGIVASLSTLFEEPIPSDGVEYSLKDVLFNLPYIHRAFHLTFSSPELFMPIVNPRFVFDKDREEAWFEARLEREHSPVQ